MYASNFLTSFFSPYFRKVREHKPKGPQIETANPNRNRQLAPQPEAAAPAPLSRKERHFCIQLLSN